MSQDRKLWPVPAGAIRVSYHKRSWSCDGCKKAGSADIPVGMSFEQTLKWIQDVHREMSPSCRNVKAKLAPKVSEGGPRSFLDNFTETGGHRHYYLVDPGPLDKSEYKDGPLIRIAYK